MSGIRSRVIADDASHLRQTDTGRDIVLMPSFTTDGPCFNLQRVKDMNQ